MNIPDSACRSVGIVSEHIDYEDDFRVIQADITLRDLSKARLYPPHITEGIEDDFLNINTNQDAYEFCKKYGLFHAYESLILRTFFDMVTYGIKVAANSEDEQEINKIILKAHKEAIKFSEASEVEVPISAHCEWSQVHNEHGVYSGEPELHIVFNLFDNDIDYQVMVFDYTRFLEAIYKPPRITRHLKIPIKRIKHGNLILVYSEIAPAIVNCSRKLRGLIKANELNVIAKDFFNRCTWEITDKSFRISIPGLYQAILWKVLNKATKGFFELRKCNHCNRVFIPNRKTQIYCSLTCQKKAKTQRSYQRRKSQKQEE